MEHSSRSGLQTFREHVLVSFSIVELLFDFSVTYLREPRPYEESGSKRGKYFVLVLHELGKYQRGLIELRSKFSHWEKKPHPQKKVEIFNLGKTLYLAPSSKRYP